MPVAGTVTQKQKIRKVLISQTELKTATEKLCSSLLKIVMIMPIYNKRRVENAETKHQISINFCNHSGLQ
jgi:hypothetical protein